MRPTSSELLERIAERLRTEIAPLVADQPWPASELRSIDALLAFVVARLDHEVEVLTVDNAELHDLLTALAAAGLPAVAEIAELGLREAEGAPLGPAVTAAQLDAVNVAYRRALEQALHVLHANACASEIATVRAYLARAAERERAVYGPLLSRPLF